MTSMRISELADRTGVPASTLRFYEKNGLLPAGRTASGYRVYDDDAIDRLAFIKAVKLLGLSLGEVSALVAVWASGTCDDVRADLRPRLMTRIADTERRQADLAAFAAALARVLRRLDAMPARPERCDVRCGYADSGLWPPGQPGDPSPPRHATTSAGPARTTPIACSLQAADVAGRVAEWRAVLADAECAAIAGGTRLTVPADRAAPLAALAAAEQRCCPFFEFTLQFDGQVLHLDVRAPAAAEDMLAALFH